MESTAKIGSENDGFFCSGALIRPESMHDSSKAFVITNGHCTVTGSSQIGNKCAPGPFQQIDSSPPETCEKAKIKISVKNKNNVFKNVHPERLEFASMKNTDLAIYRLKESYSDLKKKGIDNVFVVESGTNVRPDDRLTISSGYHNRDFSCVVDTTDADLVEADYHWSKSIKMKKSPNCMILPGTSGSPLFKASNNKKELVGIMNTFSEKESRASPAGSINHPMEKNALDYQDDVSYGQTLVNFGRCFDQKGFNRTLQGCPFSS